MYYIRSNSFEVLRSFSIWNLEAKFTFEKINLIKSLRKHNKQTLVHSKSEFRILAKIKDKKRLFNYLKTMFTFCLLLSVLLKFIYSEKATIFCEIFTSLLSYVVLVKSKVKISQNFLAFSEYMNFNNNNKDHNDRNDHKHMKAGKRFFD